MKAYDIVGYVLHECDVFCTDCANHGYPIFAGSEWDVAPACDECGDVLDVVVITEGSSTPPTMMCQGGGAG